MNVDPSLWGTYAGTFADWEEEGVKSQNNLPRAKTDWETPDELMQVLNNEFAYSGFDLDPCATPSTARGRFAYGPGTDNPDGLVTDWLAGTVYVNPPYGRGIGVWVERCYRQVECGNAGLVVALLPVSPDTRWWQTWVSQATEVRFLKGRVTFVGADGPAPFASAIVVWRRGMLGWHRVSYWDWRAK